MRMKNQFKNILHLVLSNLNYPQNKIIIQIPKNPEHGDFTTNYPMINSKEIGKAPTEIAEIIVNKINSLSDDVIEKAEYVAPGFINVRINKNTLSNQLQKIMEADQNFGKNQNGNNKSALIEFVSANPTGPLTVGHGRNAILGDTICNILEWNGYKISRCT